MSCMNKKFFLVLPFLLLNSVILVVALFKMVRLSLGIYPLIGLHKMTFAYYQELVTNKLFFTSIINSFCLAIVATLLALVIGLAAALALAKNDNRIVHGFYQLPITLPHLIVALMIMQLFSQTGLFSRLAYHFGLIQQIGEFPLLIHDDLGIGILLVFLYKEIPYVAVSVLAIVKQLQGGYQAVAYNLGASKRQTFFKVTLPLLQPTLATLFIILFCFTFASFEVPFLLGSPKNEMIAVTAYDLFTQADLTTRPQAFALNVVMTLICVIVSASTLWISYLLPGGRRSR